MKKVLRLTESDLHRIIANSVKRALREGYHDKVSDEDDEKDDFFDPDGNSPRIRKSGRNKKRDTKLPFEMEGKLSKTAIKEAHGLPDSTTAIIYSDIIEDYQAQEIAEEYGISEEEGAAEWFKGVADEMDYAEDDMPLYREFVMNIPELNSKLYHDYGAGYYFLVKNADPSSAPMTMENTIRRAVRESIKRLVETDCAGVMQTGCGDAPKGTNPEAGQYTTAYSADDETKDRHPGFSVDGKAEWHKNENFSIMRRPMYNPKSGKKK